MYQAEETTESIFDVITHAQGLADAGAVHAAIAAYANWLKTGSSQTAYAAHFNIAILYFQIGKTGLAQAALRACLACNPSFDGAKSLCVEPHLDAHRPMATRTSYSHQVLRIGWLGSAEKLRSNPFLAYPEQHKYLQCEHVFLGWGSDLPGNAKDLTRATDGEAACLIRSLEVDVLVDLMGWESGARPGIVAYHPASWQLTWSSDDPQPSGMTAVDGAMVSLLKIPSDSLSYFAEPLIDIGPTSFVSHAELRAFRLRIENRMRDCHAKLPCRPKFAKPSARALAYVTPPKSRGRRYTIVAPPYEHTSAGIRVLYELQKWLVCAGYDAIVCTWFQGYPVAAFEEDIVIYPEVAPGNLLNANRVVRYILNTPGKLGHGEKTYSGDELLVAYNTQLAPYADGLVLQVPSTESFFHANEALRDKDAFYVGKGQNLRLHPEGCIEITKSFPATRLSLANFLRSVNTLYSYDNFTMLALEAKLCGCKVMLIDVRGEFNQLENVDVPDSVEFSAQLHQFIELTQRL